MKRYTRMAALLILATLYSLAAGAPFFSPYSPKQQFREHFHSPPQSIVFADGAGNWRLRPHVRSLERIDGRPTYRAGDQVYPMRFFVKGWPYTILGQTFETHLFGFDPGSPPFFLLGSDNLGRDLFSRILFGARFSLTVGLAAITLTIALGVTAGAVAGYFTGWSDSILMRLADLLLALPSLFLVLGIRAVFPRDLSLWELYWLIVLVFTLLGWATVARVVRGQVLSLKTREHVEAARALGASEWRILTRHILPFTRSYLKVQATLLVPTFILGEITLSFLGVGVQEPDASWGNLLSAANTVGTLSRPWLLSPAAFLLITVLAFKLLSDETADPQQRLDIW